MSQNWEAFDAKQDKYIPARPPTVTFKPTGRIYFNSTVVKKYFKGRTKIRVLYHKGAKRLAFQPLEKGKECLSLVCPHRSLRSSGGYIQSVGVFKKWNLHFKKKVTLQAQWDSVAEWITVDLQAEEKNAK